MPQQDAEVEGESPKLLDCPFCGSTAELMCTSQDDDDRAPRPHYLFIIECTTCAARISETSSRSFGDRAPSLNEVDLKARSEAIVKWNRRAGTPAS